MNLLNGVTTLFVVFVLVPLGLIWCLNTLFVANSIPYDWKSWLAMLVLRPYSDVECDLVVRLVLAGEADWRKTTGAQIERSGGRVRHTWYQFTNPGMDRPADLPVMDQAADPTLTGQPATPNLEKPEAICSQK